MEVSCAVPGRAGSSFLLLSGVFLFSLNYGKSSCGELCIFFPKQSAPSVFATCVCLLSQRCSALQVSDLMSGRAVQPWKLNLT